MVECSNFSLSGRTALITGSPQGIGRALSLGLADAGATIIAHAREENDDTRSLRRALEALNCFGGEVFCDLANIEATQIALGDFVDRVDILILNASYECREGLLSAKPDSVDRQYFVNLRSSIFIVQHFARSMINRKWGRIIGLGSVQEVHANPQLSPYAALKAAQTQYLKTLARELAPNHITVNTLAPGAIRTQRNSEVLANVSYRESVEKRIPAGRIGDPKDCVGAAVFLASDAASYITGAWLPVDGGFHAN